MSDATLRLTVWTGNHVYETVTIERASVAEIRDAPVSAFNLDAMYHCTVVTDRKSYVVQGARAQIAEKIWPSPPVCEKCRRPL